MNPLATGREGHAPLFRLILLIIVSSFSSAVTSRAQKLNESVLYSLTNAPDGQYPIGGVILGSDGSLYGTCGYGGTNNAGTLFQINRSGSGYHVLRWFDAGSGSNPNRLLQGTNGMLYGTATSGASNGVGTIFMINTNGTGYAQLHALSTEEGAYPGALFPGSNGVLYGVAAQGGISNLGTAFRLNLDGSGFQVLHQFTNSPDGTIPYMVIQGNDGALYGIASGGGTTNSGVVFRMSTNGNNYTILRSFTNQPDGAQPEANLIQGKDGMLYGTTVFGGGAYAYGGTLFKLNTNGSGYVVLHEFPTIAGDGTNPEWLTQTADGTIYGVAANSGGQYGDGMIFKLDTNGNYTVVYDFAKSPPDGRNPVAPLIDGADGALYGTANHGGVYDQGTVFRLTSPLMLSMQSTNVGGTNFTIFSWPAWASDYGVRTSPTLESNATWTAIGASVMLGDKLFTTNKNTATNAFFRLQTGP